MKDYLYEITIGMPVYGVEPYIRRCILSVLNQTFKNDIEIIVVDDCGPDNSIEIVKELQISHPKGKNIKILIQPQNMGCWAARNRILEEAKGKYIMLIDSDDYITEDCIDKLYFQAIKHNAEAVWGSVLTVDVNGNHVDIGQDFLSQPYLVLKGDDSLASFANKSIHPTLRDFIWNILFKRDFIVNNNIRFKKARFNDDMIFSCDMIPLVSRAVLIPDYTYYYVIRDNSLSNYQHRDIIKQDEIIEFIRIYSYLKNKCIELKDKSYYETRCTKGMILMFFTVCGILKNWDRITPHVEKGVIREAMKHPLPIKEILQFERHKLVNIAFYLIGALPNSISFLAIKLLGKIKHIL